MSGHAWRASRLVVGVVLSIVVLAGCSHFVVLRDPLTATEHNDLGVAYEASGDAELASKEYRKSLRLDADQSRAWVNLGNVQAAQGRWRDAERSFRSALRKFSTDADAMNNLAVALMRQDRNAAEARSWAERAVALGGERDSIYLATLAEVMRGRP